MDGRADTGLLHGCYDWQRLVTVFIQAVKEARKVRLWHWGVESASHQDIAQGAASSVKEWFRR